MLPAFHGSSQQGLFQKDIIVCEVLTFCSNVGKDWVGLGVLGLFPVNEFTAVCEDIFENPSISCSRQPALCVQESCVFPKMNKLQ